MTTPALLKTWDVPRMIRAALAVIFLVAGLVEHEPVALVLSSVLGLQVAFNAGCLGSACARPGTNVNKSSNREVIYEEIHGI